MNNGYYDSRRRAVNEASRAWATNDREPWTYEEDKDLAEYWDGRDEQLLIETSEVMERTVEACRNRWYILRRKGVHRRIREQTTTINMPGGSITFQDTVYDDHYIGAFDEPEDVWWK